MGHACDSSELARSIFDFSEKPSVIESLELVDVRVWLLTSSHEASLLAGKIPSAMDSLGLGLANKETSLSQNRNNVEYVPRE